MNFWVVERFSKEHQRFYGKFGLLHEMNFESTKRNCKIFVGIIQEFRMLDKA